MKKILAHLKGTVTAGIILLIPAFALILLFEQFYGRLKGFGEKLAELLDLESMIGLGAVAVATLLILLAVFYAGGLLVHFSFLTRTAAWLENNILQFLPGYLGYKVKMEEKLLKHQEQNVPVLVTVGEIMRPGFLRDRMGDKCAVFIPNTPDTNSGEVWVVDGAAVQEIPVSEPRFLAAIMHGGKGLQVK